MRNYRLFLVYYTLAALLAVFFWSIFWGPKPQSLILPVLLTPVAIYFWLVFSGRPAEDIDSQEHSKFPLIVIATLFISSVSMFAYAASPTANSMLDTLSTQIQSLHNDIASLNKLPSNPDASTAAELKKIKSDIASLKSNQTYSNNDNLLGVETSSGVVTINDPKNKTVNVYQDKSLTATVSAKIEFGKTYPFIDKGLDWYLILASGKQGFVQSSLLKEVND